MVVTTKNKRLFKNVHTLVNSKFEVNSLGEISYFLVLEVIKPNDNQFKIRQIQYIEKILTKLPCYEYRSLVESLLYVAVNIRPDICTSLAILSRKTSNPNRED